MIGSIHARIRIQDQGGTVGQMASDANSTLAQRAESKLQQLLWLKMASDDADNQDVRSLQTATPGGFSSELISPLQAAGRRMPHGRSTLISINAAFAQRCNQKLMHRIFKSIGAVSIVALTLTAVTETSAQAAMSDLADLEICATREAGDQGPYPSVFVREAERRGFDSKRCRQLMAQSCSRILARPEIQKLAATALAETKQEWNGSRQRFAAGDVVVFTVFQQKLLRIVQTNITIPPIFGPGSPGPAYDYNFAADAQRAVHDMTEFQFQACFPQAWGLMLIAAKLKRELKEQQETARQQAAIEAAKPISRLRLAYFNYVVVKRCYDVRLGYQSVYINEVELERAKRVANAIEASTLKEDSSIDTKNTWREAELMKNASQQYVERYFCQKTYNDLLSGAPYSPPEKDFGVH